MIVSSLSFSYPPIPAPYILQTLPMSGKITHQHTRYEGIRVKKIPKKSNINTKNNIFTNSLPTFFQYL